MLNGVDISKWQGKIDWSKMQAKHQAGQLDFVHIRAGSIEDATGVCYTDFQFDNNIAGAEGTGIPYALFWFVRLNKDPKKQADYFLNLASKCRLGKLKVDLYSDNEQAGAASVLKVFIEALAASGKTVGDYTNLNTIKYLLTGDKTWLAKYQLWLADYTAPYPTPAPWTDWLVLQYSSTGKAIDYGCPPPPYADDDIDLNYAKDGYVLVAPPPPPPSDLEARVKELEHDVIIINQLLDEDAERLTELTDRVRVLEARPSAAIPSYAESFKLAGKTPARFMKQSNAAGRMVIEIYPGDGSEASQRRYYEGTIKVLPIIIVADGALKVYPVWDTAAPEQMYVRVEDGELVR